MTRHTLHRAGYPSLTPQTLGKAHKDGRAHKPVSIDEIEARLPDRLNGPPRMVRIGEPRSRLIGAFALALVVFLVIYFGGYYAVAVL